MCAGSRRDHRQLSENSFAGSEQCLSGLLSLGLFLVLSLPCSESEGCGPCGLLFQGWRIGRHLGKGQRNRYFSLSVAAQPLWLQLLQGRATRFQPAPGDSTPELCNPHPLPSALQPYQLPVFAVSGCLTAPWLASGLFHPWCNQSLHQSPSVSNSSVVSVSWSDPDLHTRLASWSALIRGGCC